jgi:hypothetical protein
MTVGQVVCTTAPHGWTAWFEAHPGTAAWLQGAGTVTALLTALIGGGLALRRYRRDGFLPKARAVRDRTGRCAVVTVENIGRAPGLLEAVFVERDGDEYQPQPRIRPRDPQIKFPATVRSDHKIAVLLDTGEELFSQKKTRIIVQLGVGEISPRMRRMRRGHRIDTSAYGKPMISGSSQEGSADTGQLQEGAPGMGAQQNSCLLGPWEAAGLELDRLARLRHAGLISQADLMIGRYRAVRQAQRGTR